jgi:ferredoxin
MAKYKVIYDREACIGAFACSAAAPEFWIFNEDGKADLKNATFNQETRQWELIVTEESDFDDNQAAAETCPVFAIKIEKLGDDTDERHDMGDWKGHEPFEEHSSTEEKGYSDNQSLD